MKKLKNSELNRISIEEFKNSSKTPIKVMLEVYLDRVTLF